MISLSTVPSVEVGGGWRVGVGVGSGVAVLVGIGVGVKVGVGAAAVWELERLTASFVSVAAFSSADGLHAVRNTKRTIPTIPVL